MYKINLCQLSGGNFAVIWVLKICGILRKFCGLLQFCINFFCRDLEKFAVNLRSQKFYGPNIKIFLSPRRANFFIAHKLYFWTPQKMLIILMILKGHFKKNISLILKHFGTLFTFFNPPQNHAFIRKSTFKFPKKQIMRNFAEFCGPQNSPAIIHIFKASFRR